MSLLPKIIAFEVVKLMLLSRSYKNQTNVAFNRHDNNISQKKSRDGGEPSNNNGAASVKQDPTFLPITKTRLC